MGAIQNIFHFSLDIKRQSNVLLNRIVNGDTAVEFYIKVTDDGSAVDLDDYNKVLAVFHRADGRVYTQNVTITDDSEVYIRVSTASYRSGRNTVELQLYSRENTTDTTYPDLVTTETATFVARAATLVGEGETAPSQIPMLEQLITDAQDAIDAAEEATAAAQEATRLAHLAAQSATRAIASIPFVVTAEDPMWNGLNFTAYADCSDETFTNAVDAGRPIIVRVLGPDEDSIISMYQVSQDAGTHDIICENTWMECSIYVGGAMIEVSGGAKHS